MLGRQRARPLRERLRELIWPSGGWRRAGLYLLARLQRLPGTPHAIAAGFAAGAAASMTPLLGFHILLAFLLAFIARGSMLAAVIGTVVGNPWTFPFIWLGTHQLGMVILGGDALPVDAGDLSLGLLFERVATLLWPMLIGSVPCALVVWLVFYFSLRAFVGSFQRRRRRALEGRRAARGTPVPSITR